MNILGSLTDKEKNAVEELQMRVKSIVTPKMREDDYLYYRFLKARNFDVDKAEKMMRKHVTWRKINQIDTILEDFQPSEFFIKYIEPSLFGFDKKGDMLRYSPLGTLSPIDVMKSTTMSHFMKEWFWFVEDSVAIIKAENEKTGRNAYQCVLILNLDEVPLSSITSSITVNLFLRFITEYQDNYPERLKYAILINAPSSIVLIFSILKNIMSGDLIKKIFIFGSSGWKEKLLEIIDEDVLPAFLGGNRTDPDGDPLCKTYLNHDTKIPKYYFLTDEERYFSKTSQPKKIIISPKEMEEIQIEVNELGALIHWEFHVKSKDIGFGIHLESPSRKPIEIIPVSKYDTADGAEKRSLKCRSTGKYTIIFDNSYSWLNAKEVQYCIRVVKPDA